MFDSTRFRARSIATIGVASALVVGGVAAAQDNGSSGAGEGSQQGTEAPGKTGKRMPPPMIGPMVGGLTYGELHVKTKEGEEETIRLDQGEIVSVDSTSITVSENDGNEVTVPLNGNTTVFAGPGGESGVDDLATGDQVTVSGPEGGAAKSVIVMPKKGDLPPKGDFKGDAPKLNAAPPPPPQGAQMGS